MSKYEYYKLKKFEIHDQGDSQQFISLLVNGVSYPTFKQIFNWYFFQYNGTASFYTEDYDWLRCDIGDSQASSGKMSFQVCHLSHSNHIDLNLNCAQNRKEYLTFVLGP